MHSLFGFKGLEDGLVGREMSKFDVRAGLVEDLVDLEDFQRVWGERVKGPGGGRSRFGREGCSLFY